MNPSRQHRLAVAAAVAALLGVASAVQAGECPADKRVAEGKGQPMSDTPASGVTDKVLTATDLAKEPVAINGRLYGTTPVVIYSFDLFRADDKTHEQMM